VSAEQVNRQDALHHHLIKGDGDFLAVFDVLDLVGTAGG
jgi:hypothetical protein